MIKENFTNISKKRNKKREGRKSMFCKFCGKEIEEGKECGCVESLKNVKENINGQAQPIKNVSIKEVFDVAVSFAKNPATELELSIGKVDKKKLFIWGIVYIATIFLAFLIVGMRLDMWEIDFSLKMAMGAIVIILLTKLVYVAALYIANRKQNDIKTIVGGICVTTIPQTFCLLFALLFGIMKLFSFAGFVFAIGVVADVVLGYILLNLVLKDENRTLKIYLLVESMVLILDAVFVKYIVQRAVEAAFSGFGGLFY